MSLQKLSKYAYTIVFAAIVTSAITTPIAYANSESDLALEIQQQITVLLLEEATEKITSSNQVSSKVKGCRNSQITFYSPVSGSVHNTISEFQFYTNANTKISSFELTINEKTYPVQYKQLPDGSYHARVVNLDNIRGNVYVAIGAQSNSIDSCNDLLYTSFTLAKANKPSVAVKESTGETVVKQNTNVIATDTVKTEVVVVVDELEKEKVISATASGTGIVEVEDTDTVVVQTEEEQINENNPGFWSSLFGSLFGGIKVANTEEATSTSEVIVENTEEEDLTEPVTITTATSGQTSFQTASLFGLIDSTKERCMTVGSQWSWFVWLGVIWLWLIGIWVAISYYAEPAFGTKSYANRLTWIIVAAGLIGLLVWFVTNPCFTHAWLPVTFIALSILLHWLYSEDAEVQ